MLIDRSDRFVARAVFGMNGISRHSVHSAPDSRTNRMEGIRFTRNRQNTRSFGKILSGNPTRPPCSQSRSQSPLRLAFATRPRALGQTFSKVTNVRDEPDEPDQEPRSGFRFKADTADLREGMRIYRKGQKKRQPPPLPVCQ